jgi:hypothetical protein
MIAATPGHQAKKTTQTAPATFKEPAAMMADRGAALSAKVRSTNVTIFFNPGFDNGDLLLESHQDGNT